MIQEPFAIGNSCVHNLDPRFRIIIAMLFTFTIALSKGFSVLIASLCVSILLVCLARLHARDVFKRLSVVLGFLLLIWLFLPITYEGEMLYKIGPLVITEPGVILCAQISIKSTAIFLTFMALIATMSIATLGRSMIYLYIPGKLVYLMLMTYRYIFVIEQEYKRLFTAIKIRGFRSKTNLHSYKTYAYLIGMLFVRASTRAERVHQAMLCRGFRGRFYSLDNYTSSGQNWFFVIFMIAIILCLIFTEINFR